MAKPKCVAIEEAEAQGFIAEERVGYRRGRRAHQGFGSTLSWRTGSCYRFRQSCPQADLHQHTKLDSSGLYC